MSTSRSDAPEPDWATRWPRRPSSRRCTTAGAASRSTGMAIQTGALILVMGLYGFAPDAMGEPAIGSDHLGAARRRRARSS